MEAYQTEAGGYMGVSAVVEPSLCVPAGEEVVGTEHSPLLEQQEEEEEEVKVRHAAGKVVQNYMSLAIPSSQGLLSKHTRVYYKSYI